MRRKKLFIALSIIIPIVIVVTVVFVIPIVGDLTGGTMHQYSNIRTFGIIDEFSFVESIDAEILAPDIDRYIKDINYAESVKYKIKYQNKVFNIYAYVFENIEDSRRYFKNVNGITAEEKHWSGSGNYYFSTNVAVLYNEKVYRIEGPGQKKFTEFLKVMESYLTGPKITQG